MKIRSLLLGSVAIAGLGTGGAYAADLGVMTSLDICDKLGLSGLTISSDTNCLQVTGEVKYYFKWGDFKNNTASGAIDVGGVAIVNTPAGDQSYDFGNGYNDWESRFDAWIKFVATGNSDFGQAKAVIKLLEVNDKQYYAFSTTSVSATGVTTATASSPITVTGSGGTVTISGFATGTTGVGTTGVSAISTWDGDDKMRPNEGQGVWLDEAYVSIGDSTVIMAGKKGSIFADGDDEPLNYLGLFNSGKVDAGVGPRSDGSVDSNLGTGGHVIQVTSDLGNGFSVSGGLENLNGSDYDYAGTAVGVLQYAGDGISAHASFAADGVLSGEIKDWEIHTGFAGTFDNFKLVGAAYFDSSDYWNVLASASATFDMFTIAGSIEAAAGNDDDSVIGAKNEGPDDYFGAGASLSAKVTDTVTLNLGGRWAHETDGDESYEVAAGVTAAVTDSIKLTGKVGYVNDGYQDLFYGQGKLDWAPGGDTFTSSLTGTINSDGGMKVETEFKKSFQ